MIRYSAFLLFFLIGSASLAQAESFHYHIIQMGIKAGDAYLSWGGETVYKGKNTLLVNFKADGFNFFDEEKIYLDPQSYKPLFVERNLNIFGKKEQISEEYLTDLGQIKISKITDNTTSEQILDKAGVVDNIYGFIFRYRKSGSFKVGDVIDINLPTKSLEIELMRMLKVQAAGQVYNSFYMQSKPAKYKIWFSADAKRLPLRISGAVGIANTIMVMADYKE